MALDRPSLDFYSDRQIVNQSIEELKQRWQENATVYLLVDSLALKQLNLPQQAIAKDAQFESLGWMLAIKNRKSILAGQLR